MELFHSVQQFPRWPMRPPYPPIKCYCQTGPPHWPTFLELQLHLLMHPVHQFLRTLKHFAYKKQLICELCCIAMNCMQNVSDFLEISTSLEGSLTPTGLTKSQRRYNCQPDLRLLIIKIQKLRLIYTNLILLFFLL
jgi:hypothetical protein